MNLCRLANAGQEITFLFAKYSAKTGAQFTEWTGNRVYHRHLYGGSWGWFQGTFIVEMKERSDPINGVFGNEQR